MSFNSPFFDFFGVINDEVDAFSNRLADANTPSNGSVVKANRDRKGKWHLQGVDIVPPIDVLEDENGYVIHASIPGMKSQEDINLEFHRASNEIVIYGEVPSVETEQNKNGWRIRERSKGSFRRVISLPRQPGVDVDNITADYKNGVLTLNVSKLTPKDNPNNVHKISIGEKKQES